MTPLARLLALTALALAGAAHAQDDDWSDEAVWITVGQTFGLTKRLRARVFEDQAVRSELRRAGIPAGCSVVERFIDDSAMRESQAYRELIVAEVRAALPPAPDLQQKIGVTPNTMSFDRMLRKVERAEPAMFDRLHKGVPAVLLPELRALPPMTGEWRGPVADWNFETPIQTIWSTACLVSNSSEPTRVKLAFDGFFQTSAR